MGLDTHHLVEIYFSYSVEDVELYNTLSAAAADDSRPFEDMMGS